MEQFYSLNLDLRQELNGEEAQALNRLLEAQEDAEAELNYLVESELSQRLRKYVELDDRNPVIDVSSNLYIRRGSLEIFGDIDLLIAVAASLIAIKNEIRDILQRWIGTNFGASAGRRARPRITPTIGPAPASRISKPLEVKVTIEGSSLERYLVVYPLLIFVSLMVVVVFR